MRMNYGMLAPGKHRNCGFAARSTTPMYPSSRISSQYPKIQVFVKGQIWRREWGFGGEGAIGSERLYFYGAIATGNRFIYNSLRGAPPPNGFFGYFLVRTQESNALCSTPI